MFSYDTMKYCCLALLPSSLLFFATILMSYRDMQSRKMNCKEKKGKILIDFWYLLWLLPQQLSFNNGDWCFVITLCCDLFNILAPRKKREWVVRYEIEHERKIVVKWVSFRDSRNYFYTEIRRFFLSAQLQWLFHTKKNVLRKFLINKSLNYFCCHSTKCY